MIRDDRQWISSSTVVIVAVSDDTLTDCMWVSRSAHCATWLLRS